MTPNFILTGFLAITLLFWGCQSTETPRNLVAPEAVENDQSLSLTFHTAGRALAMMMADLEVRDFTRAKALEQFDGDYDVLYRDIKNVRLANGETFEERLMHFVTTSPDCFAKFPQTLANLPKLQISVPLHCETWQTKTHIPLVAIQPSYTLDKEVEQVTAYDQQGYRSFLSTQEEPEQAVVVMGMSERTDEEGN